MADETESDLRAPPAGSPDAGVATPFDGVAREVYRQLKSIAHVRMLGERPGHMLHTTALVHEAMLKMTQGGQMALQDRPAFFRAAAASMRQILIDHARAAGTYKRGGGGRRAAVDLNDVSDPVQIDLDRLLVIDEAMARLHQHDYRSAEVVRLRFYAGLTMHEVGETLGISLRATERLWTYARGWLWRELGSIDA
jgi:RNA polymerase sigma factor (TIGR02999 family)